MEFKFIYVVIAAVLAVNVINFCLYGIDKRKAVKDKRRISERTLLLWSVFAPFGGAAGMHFFRHKTKKFYFGLVNILMCIVHIAAVVAVVYLKNQ